MQATIHRSSPDTRFLEIARLGIEENRFYLALRSHAMDQDVYKMILVMPLDQGMMQANFNCPYQQYEIWKPIILQVWDTIKETEKEWGHRRGYNNYESR